MGQPDAKHEYRLLKEGEDVVSSNHSSGESSPMEGHVADMPHCAAGDVKISIFATTRTATDFSLGSLYSRMALANVLCSSFDELQDSLTGILRMAHYSLPEGLPMIRQLLLRTLLAEVAEQGAPVGTVTAVLIQEVVFQLLMTCRSQDAVNDRTITRGTCPNPKLALWLLELFVEVYVDHSNRCAEPLATRLCRIRPRIFTSMILGLWSQAVRIISSVDVRVALINLLSKLFLANNKARRNPGPQCDEVLLMDPAHFSPLRLLMFEMHEKKLRGSLLRALINLNMAHDDDAWHQRAQEQKNDDTDAPVWYRGLRLVHCFMSFMETPTDLSAFQFPAGLEEQLMPMSRAAWRELTSLMNQWSDKNQGKIPDEKKIVLRSWLPRFSNLQGVEAGDIKSAMRVLLKFNNALQKSHGLIDLHLAPNISALTDGFRRCRDLIFTRHKKAVFDEAMKATHGRRGRIAIMVDPLRAAAFEARPGAMDSRARETFFGQVYTQLSRENPELWRIGFGQRAFKCDYKGLHSIDAGGPYRDCITRVSVDIEAGYLPLFVPVSNKQNDIGENRDAVIPNPASTTSSHLRMFEFVGKWLGLALRSRNLLNLHFPSVVWRPLVGAPIGLDDIEAIDLMTVNLLQAVQSQDEKAFNDSGLDLQFTVMGNDGTMHELCDGGESKLVTFSNRQEYVALLTEFRLKEFEQQTAAIRRGLGQVVPLDAVALYTWQELQTMVCGRGFTVEDVTLLQQMTEYRGYSRNHQVVRWLFDILRNDFTDKQRSDFLIFVWGRSRLPLTKEEFDTRFKVATKRGGNAHFPLAHTCFFQIDLPNYTSRAAMLARLTTAISMCGFIDGD